MESLLQGIPSVCLYIYDVLVTGTTEQDHLANLTKVLRRMSASGMRLKREKCSFMFPEVHYLGHTVSSKGIQPTQEKICSIRDAPAPTDLHQLKSFLKLLNFYAKVSAKFVNCFSTGVFFVAEKSTLVVGSRASTRIPASETTTHLCIASRSLQRQLRTTSGRRCIALCSWHCIVPSNARWN